MTESTIQAVFIYPIVVGSILVLVYLYKRCFLGSAFSKYLDRKCPLLCCVDSSNTATSQINDNNNNNGAGNYPVRIEVIESINRPQSIPAGFPNSQYSSIQNYGSAFQNMEPPPAYHTATSK